MTGEGSPVPVERWNNPFKMVCVSFEKSSGTNGGAASTGAWTKYAINTLDKDGIGGVLDPNSNTNRIRVPNGIYVVAQAWFFSTGPSRMTWRLYNNTTGQELLRGSVANGSSGTAMSGTLPLWTPFTVTVQSDLEVDYYARSSVDGADLGASQVATGGNERYGFLALLKIG